METFETPKGKFRLKVRDRTLIYQQVEGYNCYAEARGGQQQGRPESVQRRKGLLHLTWSLFGAGGNPKRGGVIRRIKG